MGRSNIIFICKEQKMEGWGEFGNGSNPFYQWFGYTLSDYLMFMDSMASGKQNWVGGRVTVKEEDHGENSCNREPAGLEDHKNIGIKQQEEVLHGPSALSSLQQEKPNQQQSISQQQKPRQRPSNAKSKTAKEQDKISWSKDDDQVLRELVSVVGKRWKYISEQLSNHSPKQVRERYLNHIRPNISHEKWTPEEDDFLLQLILQYGYRWKFLETKIRNRSQNQIKNRYYGHLTKKMHKKLMERQMEQNNLKSQASQLLQSIGKDKN